MNCDMELHEGLIELGDVVMIVRISSTTMG